MTVGRQRLHAQGPALSRLVFGTMRLLDSPETRDVGGLARLIAALVDLGITTMDHADIYGGYAVEEHFGAALRAWGGDRSRLELVTKCGIGLVTGSRPAHRVKHYDTSADYIARSIDRSLACLGTDYIDVFLIHRPDPLMEADEVAKALERARREGKVRHLGVSNHAPHQLELLQSRLSRPVVTNQVELSVLQMAALHDGTLDQAQRLGFSPMIWSPLGGARLFTSRDERERRVRHALQAVADEIGGVDMAQVALAWVLRHPTRPLPVLGTGRLERVREYVRAAELNLERQQWFRIWEASEGQPVP